MTTVKTPSASPARLRIVALLILVIFVVELMQDGCDPYLAVYGALAVAAAAMRLVSRHVTEPES